MLKILRQTIASIVLAVSIYGLFSDNNDLLPFTMAGLAIMMVIMGLEDRQKDPKSYRSYLYYGVSAFLLFVSVEGLIY
ncbi:hypothetical protein LCL96_14445 [Rossellomorea aquimaris]|uniref:hypothetical protein n=1 Tax=Rossellomorea aquimaris TaxID=189382 RepID=UPI001CD6399C|nr:hypothetical protein [Rossellomorea aquimaris]MCA1060134.1 hypothetical protein [Rossellomorea aquimaris]